MSCGLTFTNKALNTLRLFRPKLTKNALAKHMALYHPNEDATCPARDVRYNLDMFILGAVEIEEAKSDNNIHVINSMK